MNDITSYDLLVISFWGLIATVVKIIKEKHAGSDQLAKPKSFEFIKITILKLGFFNSITSFNS